MSHLSTDRLAALADERPAPAEQDHLEACASCAREIEAHRSLLAMAVGEREMMGIPLTRWDALARQLRSESLIADGHPATVTAEWAAPLGRHRPPSTRALLRVAAALVLVASGALIGRASMGAPLLPGGLTGSESVAFRPFSPEAIPTTFASVVEAERYKDAAANAYQHAVSFLAMNDSISRLAETPAVMRTRLSALDRVSRTMREALADAPYDPIINDFYLNSFGQREATLRQLNAVLPQGGRMSGF
ncbi:MAG: hypothetical protein WD801_01060 [Gemmatimonadaceae bacterium]